MIPWTYPGTLLHFLDKVRQGRTEAGAMEERINISGGTIGEPIAGYSRAVRAVAFVRGAGQLEADEDRRRAAENALQNEMAEARLPP
jgi:hypothetical protein